MWEKGPRQGLDDATLTAEAKYSINFSKSQRKLFIIMEVTVFCLLKVEKYISSKKNILKQNLLCLGNISKDFIANSMKKIELNGYVYQFFVDFNIIDTSDIIDIHKHLMKKYDIK